MISCQMILLPSTRIISSLKTKYPVTGNNFTNKSTGFSIQISCEQLQISCLQCRHVDGDLRGLIPTAKLFSLLELTVLTYGQSKNNL